MYKKNPNGNDAMHDRLPGEIIAGNAYSLNKRANKQLYNPKHTKPHLQKLRHSRSLTTCGAKKQDKPIFTPRDKGIQPLSKF